MSAPQDQFTIARSLSLKSFREENADDIIMKSPGGDSKKDDDDLVEVTSRKSFKPGTGIDNSTSVQLMGTSTFDMGENRDPNGLNSHCQIEFDDIIGEPDGLRSPECCWNFSKGCYTYTQRFLYIILMVICAPCLSFINGCNFACLAFCQVWCVGPCLRNWKISCATVRKFYWGCLLATIGPCAEVTGLYFSKVKVRYQKLPDGNEKDEDTADAYFNV